MSTRPPLWVAPDIDGPDASDTHDTIVMDLADLPRVDRGPTPSPDYRRRIVRASLSFPRRRR